MFDFFPDSTPLQQTASPRVLALDLIARSGARLRLAAARRGGNAGVALVWAMRDMILDATVDPLHWPLDDAITLHRQPAPTRDVQVDRLAEQLERIRERIGSTPDARAA